MQAPRNFKNDFLKHMLLGLQVSGVSSSGMSLGERKRAIKLSADAAMAVARGSGANWSRALVAGMDKQESILASPPCNHKTTDLLRSTCKMMLMKRGIKKRPKIRKRRLHSQSSWKVDACVLAKSMAKRRTRVLKSIIPGGESLDGISLLSETLDYVVYLRAQVNLMQRISIAIGS